MSKTNAIRAAAAAVALSGTIETREQPAGNGGQQQATRSADPTARNVPEGSTNEIQQLREERESAVTKAQAIHRAAAEGKRAMTAEEKQEAGRLLDDAERLDEQIEARDRVRRLAEREANRGGEQRQQSAGGGGETAEQRMRRIGGQSAGGVPTSTERAAPDDAEVRSAVNAFMREGREALGDMRAEVRDLLTTVGNSVLIPDSSRRIYDEVMRHIDGIRRLNPSVISTPGNGQPIPLPVFSDTAEAEVVGEGVDITRALGDPSVQEKSLGSVKYSSGTVKLTHELIRDDQFDLLGYVERALYQRVALKRHRDEVGTVDAAAANSKAAATAATLTFAEWLSFEHSLPVIHRSTAAAVLNDDVLRLLRGLTGSDGHPLYREAIDEMGPRVGAYRYILTPFLTATNGTGAILGNFSHLFVRDIETRIKRFDELYGEEDKIGWNVLAAGDSEVGDTAAFSKLTFPNAA